MKMRRLFFIVIVLVPSMVHSQTSDMGLKRSIMLVHADFTSFSIPIGGKENLVKSIIADYEAKKIEAEGFLETEFFAIKPKCIECEECWYIVGCYHNRCYKLKGFKQNEFTEFFNLVVMREFPSLSSYSSKKALKKLLSMPVNIEKYNIQEAFNTYYENYESSMFDKSSCYRKMTILEY